jgi:DNA mismatch repair protein MutS
MNTVKGVNTEGLSPMFQRWAEIAGAAPDKTVVILRLGDFYEAFGDDAKVVSSTCNVTMTRRKEIPMAGFPAYSAKLYTDKLVEAGYSVAVCDYNTNQQHT